MLTIHITAGLLALIAGAIALYASKGAPLHRRSGMLFAVAMLVMTSSATFMAVFMFPNRINLVAGTLTFYLVSTGVLAVRRSVEQTRALLLAFMLIAAMTGAYAFWLAQQAQFSPDGLIDSLPPAPLYMFGVVAALCVLGDARMLLTGVLQGKRRLARHLWRMGYAMWIATMSFFLGQAKVFPEPLRHALGLRAIPVLLVLGVVAYWFVRVLFGRSKPASISMRYVDHGNLEWSGGKQ